MKNFKELKILLILLISGMYQDTTINGPAYDDTL